LGGYAFGFEPEMNQSGRLLLRVIVCGLLIGSCIFAWVTYNALVIYNDIDDIGAMSDAGSS